ncbi:unnamed protein product [Soboliphyme baturini]|uniref:Rad60-SLD domain-containing protein n=1 Tax=Soboliphyme baturini TaxID=241478 RepID=A0A183ILU4_9BILA|nr:unnamed protein product [Soboliphyme baturini]
MYCDPDDHDDDLLYTVRRKYRAPVVPLAEQILTPALQPANRQPKKNQTSKNDGERDSCSDIVILDDSSSDDSDASSVICLDDDNSERNTKNGETFSDRNANDSDSALDEVEKALLSTVGISVCCNRQILKFRLSRDDQFSKILELYTSHCKLPPHSVMFSFNGESIDVETTPAKLELENDDIIDVHSADT